VHLFFSFVGRDARAGLVDWVEVSSCIHYFVMRFRVHPLLRASFKAMRTK